MTSRGSRSGASRAGNSPQGLPRLDRHSDTVGVSDSSDTESAALAGEVMKPARHEHRSHQDQRDAEPDDAAPPGQAQRRLGAWFVRDSQRPEA